MRPADNNLEMWLDAVASDVVQVIREMTSYKVEWSGMRKAISRELDRQYDEQLWNNPQRLIKEIADLNDAIRKEAGAEASQDLKHTRNKMQKRLMTLTEG